jgi:hypothetical protein
MFDLASSYILLDKEVVMELESVLLVEVDVPSSFGLILPSHYLCIDANNRRRNIDEFEHELRTILRVEENALLR